MRSEMIRILEEVRTLLEQACGTPWSAQEPQHILPILNEEISSLITSGQLRDPKRLRLLFAPTGALQEISLAGGWAERFLEISSRFDDSIRDHIA
jgi:hypothetical protein